MAAYADDLQALAAALRSGTWTQVYQAGDAESNERCVVQVWQEIQGDGAYLPMPLEAMLVSEVHRLVPEMTRISLIGLNDIEHVSFEIFAQAAMNLLRWEQELSYGAPIVPSPRRQQRVIVEQAESTGGP